MVTYGELPPFGFFDFAPMGAIVLTTGILYFVFIGRHLLPVRSPSGDLSKVYHIRDYLGEVRVKESSSLNGKSLSETQLGEQYNLNVLQIHRNDRDPLNPTPDQLVRSGDVLLVEGSTENLMRASEALKLEAFPDWKFEDTEDISKADQEMVEVALSPQTSLNGQTLKQIDFRARFGLNVLAIQSKGESLISKIAETPLNLGDAMLIRGPRDRIDHLRGNPEFMVLETPPLETRRLNKAPLAVLILLGVLVVVTTQLMHVSIAMLIGAILMVLTRVIDMDEAYQSIQWKSVFLIAGMLPMGIAMQNSGTAQFLAE
jgi:di/tricarboxylate transporter